MLFLQFCKKKLRLDHLQNLGVNAASGEEASQMSNFQNYRICNALPNLQPISVANIELAKLFKTLCQ